VLRAGPPPATLAAMSPMLITVAVTVALTVVLLAGFLLVVKRLYVVVPSGFALIVTRPSGPPAVSFSGAIVLPGIHRAELLDLRVRSLRIERSAANPLLTKDGQRVIVTASFSLRVSRSVDDLLRLTQNLGVARANDDAALAKWFGPRFEQALEESAAALTVSELLAERGALREPVLLALGADLDGLVLDDLSLTDLRRAS
jgi:uncharacterized membrane protein YqiK